jgi:hypothetical protein
MGLDMYLYAQKFVSNTPPFKEGTRHEEIVEALDAQSFAKGHIVTQMEVAYWRKANAIHNWFVGSEEEDNCEPVHVPRESLVRLRDVCKELLTDKDPDKAEELLPPVGGFFFGSTDIDEWYWENVQETATLLDNILTEVPEDWSFEYQASW